MRLHTLLGRLALPAAMIGLTTLGAALPAQADPDDQQPEVQLFVPDRVVTVDGRAKTVTFEVINVGEIAAPGLVAQFGSDESPIPASVGFTPPQGCAPTACVVGDLEPGARKSYKFAVAPTADLTELGASFAISVHDGGVAWGESATVTVVPTKSGVDLEVGAVKDINLAPGKSATVPVSVRNAGNKAVDGVAIVLAGDPYVTFPNTYSNCVAVDDLYGVICVFDQRLDADEVLTVSPSTPLKVKAARDAPGPQSYYAGLYAFGAFDEDDDELAAAAAKKAAAAPESQLKLVPVRRSLADDVDEGELNEWDNVASFFVNVSKNPADSVAIGDTFAGAIGDTRTIKVGIRNDGPAATLDPSLSWLLSAHVRIPSGLALTKVDQNCVPLGDGDPVWEQPGQVSGHEYLCVVAGNLGKGDKALFSFTAKIEDGQNEDEGSITVDGGVQDPKTSNNLAKIDVRLTGGGSGGGLPVTGAPAGLVAGGGALLLVGGAVAIVLARRRRIVTVTE
jgi:hypothetical protein